MHFAQWTHCLEGVSSNCRANRLMTDELSAPLGRKRKKKSRASAARPMALPWGRIGTGALLFLVLGLGAWIVVIEDPLGGRPVAQAPVNTATVPNPVAENLASAPQPSSPITTLQAPDGPSIITLDGAPDQENATAGIQTARDVDDLVEMTGDGPLPRVSASGLKPYEAYARPAVSAEAAGGRKRIAIVVSGLGLSAGSTRDAISALPGTVTLAFAPYGADVTELAALARTDGHEIMLEIPLEPFDYPQNDPGPHTLLVEQPPRENLEKLYWLLTRITEYTGILNHMGARFTASASDFAPIMEELGLRGLSYLDDGSSNRSVAPQLARQNGVPYARSLGTLDENPSESAIAAALDALKSEADETGQALGIVSALPVSIRTLSDWAASLDESEYLLVPVSALNTMDE